jgi:hypothetical protein
MRRHLVTTFLLFFCSYSFSQLTDFAVSADVISRTEQMGDSVSVTFEQLRVTISPDVISDMGFVAINVYEADQPLIEEISKTADALSAEGLVSANTVIIPVMSYEPSVRYTINVALRNTSGAYLPSKTLYFPN